MEQSFYTRPREKLRDRGVSALSNGELFQVIIGSGSQTASAARIAKNIGTIFAGPEPVTYEQLLGVPGVGHAKACQLLAALELSARYAHTAKPGSISSAIKVLTKNLGLYYATLDGDKRELKRRSSVSAHTQISEAEIRKMFAYAFHDNAHSLDVTLGSDDQPVAVLGEKTLGALKRIFDMSDLLEVRVDSIWVANNTERRLVRRKDIA